MAYRVQPITTSVFPRIRAMSVAVRPLLFFTLTSAALSTSSFTTDKCPNSAASWSGVSFHLSRGSTFAPQSSNRRHTSTNPYKAAWCKAVCRFYIGAALQQHSHHLHMVIRSSKYERCVIRMIISSAVVICAVEQDLHSVHVSGFSSPNQIPTVL